MQWVLYFVMFIRIKRRLLRSTLDRRKDASLRFVIVESYRVAGAPRQRIVKYLGSVRESVMRDPYQRRMVLARFQSKLENLESDIPYNQIVSLKLSLNRVIYHRTLKASK